MFDLLGRILNWFRTNIKVVLIVAIIAVIGIVILGIYIPESKLVLSWIVDIALNVVQILFWLLSLPYKLIRGV